MTAVRAMAAQDLDQVLALERGVPEAPHWDRTVYENLFTGGTSVVRYGAFVAVSGNALAGFVVARQMFEVCEIESIVVDEQFRREGLGNALLGAVATWAASDGAERLQLEVRAGNLNAIRFYEKAGLRKEGLRRGYYRDPDEDAVLMGKSLVFN